MTGVGRAPVLRELDRLFRQGTLCGLGDDELLERFLDRRDGSAFEALVSLHGPMVLGICRRMLRDPSDVEDAFQATFLVLVQKAPTIRDRALLSNWLYGVAYRVASRARARAIKRQVREIGVDRLDAYAARIPAGFADIGPVLDEELNRLPARYREPIVLCYLEGCTHDEAAQQLRCPVGTVRSRMARGRDLLRRRLIRRGCAPIAALLGGGTSMSSALSIESVPASLLSATVRSALGIAAVRGAWAATVAAPVLTLTHGVLAMMKLSQLAWIGLALLATSLSATGVIAVAYARAQSAGSTAAAPRTSGKTAVPGDNAQAQTAGSTAQSAVEALDARLKALESKLDELLSRSSTTTKSAGAASTTTSTSAASGDPFRPAEGATAGRPAESSGPTTVYAKSARAPGLVRQILDRAAAPPSGTVGAVRELETKLKLAVEDFDRTDALFQRGRTPRDAREQARGKVLLAAAVLEALDDDLADEVDRLRLEMKKKRAELHQAQAKREMAAEVVANDTRLKERNVVSESELVSARGELRIAEAQVDIKRAEIEEVDLQVNQLTRRRERIAQAIKLSQRATAEVEAAPPAR